ncbi:MAG: phosphoglycerate kinase [Chlamydiae bacterium]|nr:phosphoglycerate kinase [Chlamydiota bacterium]
MELPVIDSINFAGEKVLVRVDFNVPIENGSVTDATRIKEALPTLQKVLATNGSLILLSHLGRPQGKRDIKYSLAPVAKELASILQTPVKMASDVIGSEVKAMALALKPKEVLLLENLRFYEAEENPEKDPSFAKQLAELGTFYINDAFGAAHRAHASTADIVQYFPKKRCAGLLMEKEVTILTKIFQNPDRPFYALIGGAKVGSKMGVLYALLEKADALFIGGAMAFTFFKAQEKNVGASLVDYEHIHTAKKILDKALEKKNPIYLPIDIVTENHGTIETNKDFPIDAKGVDIGEKTIEKWQNLMQGAKTVFWNGPMGIFEVSPFEKGTFAMAKAISSLSATTVIGGGDSAYAAEKSGLSKKFTHVSTGGGAALEFIEFGSLTAIDFLKK